MYYKLIDIQTSTEVDRFTHLGAALDTASKLAGAPLHWSTDDTTLLTRNGIATFKVVRVVRVGFKGGDEWKYTASMADDVRGCSPRALVNSIRWLHGKGEWKWRDVYLLEVERQVQEEIGLPEQVGLKAGQWAQALGITHRHADCEGIEEFNHGFDRGSLQGVIRMLWCDGGGSPPTTDQFLDRERSGEWYPRSCQ